MWAGDDDAGGLSDSEFEIYGQRLDANTGTEVGPNDVRISDIGPDGNIAYDANVPAVAFNPASHEYLVVWEGDDNIGPLVEDEIEIFGQRLGDAAPGGDLMVSIEPVNPPIVIPPGGGSFRFSLTLTNTGTTAQTFDFWTAYSGPISRDPALRPKTLTLAPGATVTRKLTQRIAGGAPAGIYSYTANVGTFPATVSDSDSFQFEKSPASSAPVED